MNAMKQNFMQDTHIIFGLCFKVDQVIKAHVKKFNRVSLTFLEQNVSFMDAFVIEKIM